jgi:hypothetical protein
MGSEDRALQSAIFTLSLGTSHGFDLPALRESDVCFTLNPFCTCKTPETRSTKSSARLLAARLSTNPVRLTSGL